MQMPVDIFAEVGGSNALHCSFRMALLYDAYDRRLGFLS